MKKIALFACALSLVATSAISQTTPPTTPLPPAGVLPVGVAENLVILAPIAGALGVLGLLAGDSSNSTTSTVSTN